MNKLVKIEELQEGDVLIVCRLDRLGRSMIHLISLIADFKERKIMFLFRKLKDLVKILFSKKEKNDDKIDMYPLW